MLSYGRCRCIWRQRVRVTRAPMSRAYARRASRRRGPTTKDHQPATSRVSVDILPIWSIAIDGKISTVVASYIDFTGGYIAADRAAVGF